MKNHSLLRVDDLEETIREESSLIADSTGHHGRRRNPVPFIGQEFVVVKLITAREPGSPGLGV